MIKFSKSYSDISSIKEFYKNENSSYLKNILDINKIYLKQPLRKKCKICGNKLKKRNSFKSFTIGYIFCSKCNHLNGKYDDTLKFHKQIYLGKSKKSNFENIYSKNFQRIVKNIHLPKVKFLKKIIKKKINLIDLGSGAGHFVKACLDEKINAWGIEANENLIKFSNKSLQDRLLTIKNNDLEVLIKKYNINCLSLIFVLEHLPDPNLIFKIFKKSQLKYLYLALPMASLSIYFENLFKNIYPKQLSGTHTHLFTVDSINYLKKKYNLKIIGEWWFGTDFADLHRAVSLNLKNNNNKEFAKGFSNIFFKHIDKFQSILDKEKQCSEVHIILKK